MDAIHKIWGFAQMLNKAERKGAVLTALKAGIGQNPNSFVGTIFPLTRWILFTFYSVVLLKFYLFSSQTSWPTKYNIAYYFDIIMILLYINSSCIFTHHCWNIWWHSKGDFSSLMPFFCNDTTHLGKKSSNLFINLVVTWWRISWSQNQNKSRRDWLATDYKASTFCYPCTQSG